LRRDGYRFHLVFLWLPSSAFAIDRVASRVRMGGHAVPVETVRRYHGGVRNFFQLYQPLATTWRMYDSSNAPPVVIAEGRETRTERVFDQQCWALIRAGMVDGN
jgi:predicted ABC-type ATPase